MEKLPKRIKYRGRVYERLELTEAAVKHIEIVDDGDECPYLSGWTDEDLDISDRSDLSDRELWATGWSGIVNNEDEAPFSSFDEIDISCYDKEKGGEYNLPSISQAWKKKFVKAVNAYITNSGSEEEEIDGDFTHSVTMRVGTPVLLSVTEAGAIPRDTRAYKSGWWLKSPGYYNNYATYCSNDGYIIKLGADVEDYPFAVRPALRIQELADINPELGQKILIGGQRYVVIGSDRVLYDGEVVKHLFNDNPSNDYYKSEIRQFIEANFPNNEEVEIKY